ncbi:MAG: hypothetical protein QW818_03500 [Candidatus Aenigmatarchaeota archaeon]|nr:hypothetical protein [Candidatus Aenigmarchaeota archaeon]
MNNFEKINIYDIEITGQKDPGLVYQLEQRLTNEFRRRGVQEIHLTVDRTKSNIRVMIRIPSDYELRSALEDVIKNNGWEGEFRYTITRKQLTSEELRALERERDEYISQVLYYKNQIQQKDKRISELKSENQKLKEDAENFLADNLNLSSNLVSIQKEHETLKNRLEEAEQTIENLRVDNSDERVLERYLFDPHSLIEFYLDREREKLTGLVRLFDEFREKRQKTLFEKAIGEVGIKLPPEEYPKVLEQGKLQWEESDLYKKLKPKYDKAMEAIIFLNGLKDGTAGRDIPQHLREEVIKLLESRRKEYDETIEMFKNAETRHRQFREVVARMNRLNSQEPLGGPITEQRILYICVINKNGVRELYTPIDDELAKTFLGSLLLSQLDNLGERLPPHELFYRYHVNPETVVRTQNKYDFYKLGIRVEVVAFYRSGNGKETPSPEITGRTLEVLETIKRLTREGKKVRRYILARKLSMIPQSVEHHLKKLIDLGLISKKRINPRNVEIVLNEN